MQETQIKFEFALPLKHAIGMRCLVDPNQGYSRFPPDYWSSYEYLIQYRRFLCSLNDFIDPSPFGSLLSSKWLSYLEHGVQSP